MTKEPFAWSRERVSVAAYFAVLGLVCATWGSSIDDMKLLLGLDEAEQGWLLLLAGAMALGFAVQGANLIPEGKRDAVVPFKGEGKMSMVYMPVFFPKGTEAVVFTCEVNKIH